MSVTDGDPYIRFVALSRGLSADAMPAGDSQQAGLGAAPARMRLGKVLQRVPLKVRVAGLEQPASALRINERLVKGAKWKTKTISPSSDYNGLSGSISGPVTTPHGASTGALERISGSQLHSPDTTIDEATVEQLEIDLEVGDEVLLLTEDDQVFYIVMKAVKAV